MLIDSEPLRRRAEIEIFGEVGLVLEDADCFQAQGLRIEAALSKLEQGPTPSGRRGV